MLSQVSMQIEVFLVGTDDPGLEIVDPRLHVICDAFPIPGPGTTARATDKYLKLNRGLFEARSLAPCFYMLVDADDCLSENLATYAEAHPESNGWFVQTGYRHEYGSRWVLATRSFDLLCGSSHIIRCSAADLPDHPDRSHSTPSTILVGHHNLTNHMDKIGRPLKPLPFPGVIYEVGTGENDSGITLRRWPGARETLRRLMVLRPFTARLRREFGYCSISDSGYNGE
jgi:hypothetical protein